MSYYTLYLVRNKVTGKIYIGQHLTKKTFLEDNYWGSGKRLKDSQKKYGLSNFERRILGFCLSKEDASRMETNYIQKYKSYNPEIGYNLTKLGSIQYSVESLRISDFEKYQAFCEKQKINCKKNMLTYWKNLSPEERKCRGEAVSRRQRGRKQACSTIEKKRRSLLAYWEGCLDDKKIERNKKISQSKKGKPGRKWTLEQIQKRTETRRKNGWKRNLKKREA